MNLNYTQLMVVVWIFYGAAFFVTVCRAIARFIPQKTFGTEDYLIFIGLAFLTALSIVITVMTPKFVAVANLYANAFTNPSIMTQPEAIAVEKGAIIGLKLIFSQMFLFFSALFAAKLSLMFFFRRLILGIPRYLRIWTLTCIIIVLLYLGCMLSNILACTPLHQYWSSTGCSSVPDLKRDAKSIQFATAADIASDALVMILPLNLLRTLQLTTRQTLGLSAIFGIGFVIIGVAIARLIEVSPVTTDVTESFVSIARSPITLSAWSHIEASVAIIVASLPTFRFLLSRAASRKYYMKSQSQGNGDGPSVHTIGSAGQRKVNRFETDTTNFGSIHEEILGSTNELSNLDKSHIDDSAQKQVDYILGPDIIEPKPIYSQDVELKKEDNRGKYLHSSHSIPPSDTEAVSTDSLAKKERVFI